MNIMLLLPLSHNWIGYNIFCANFMLHFHLLSSYIMIILELLKFVLIQYFTLIWNILLLVITSFMIKSLKDFYMWLMFLWFYQRATSRCSNKTIKFSMPHFASIQDCYFLCKHHLAGVDSRKFILSKQMTTQSSMIHYSYWSYQNLPHRQIRTLKNVYFED